jgi:hypothetical protein
MPDAREVEPLQHLLTIRLLMEAIMTLARLFHTYPNKTSDIPTSIVSDNKPLLHGRINTVIKSSVIKCAGKIINMHKYPHPTHPLLDKKHALVQIVSNELME